jgi:hypothetical protein
MRNEVLSPHEVLAQAINRSGMSDETIAERVCDHLDAGMIGKFRRGEINPLPNWHKISDLLCVVGLQGQELEIVLAVVARHEP